MNLPPLGALQTLEVLSRHLRVGAAATELGLSHAAVSQTVTRMEKRLGVQLFLRGSSGVEPTATCLALVEAYLSVSSTLRRALVAAADGARFHVLAPQLVWTWFAPAIARLHQVCPNLSFRGYRADELADLDSADFAVVPSAALPEGFDGTPLYDECVIPVCSPAYARSVRLETPSAVARARLLIARRDLWLAWFSQAGLAPASPLEGPVVADPLLAMQAAAQGQGVALCCTIAAAGAIARGELVAPLGVSASAGRQMWAIWRKRSDHAVAMRVLDGLMTELHAQESDCRAPEPGSRSDQARAIARIA